MKIIIQLLKKHKSIIYIGINMLVEFLLNEEFDGEGDETVAPTGQMAAYVNATSRLIKK